MKEDSLSERDDLTLSVARQVDQACNHFELAWRSRQPRIEDFLGDAPEPARSALVRELLALELEYRGRS
jgi:hypothetical protein